MVNIDLLGVIEDGAPRSASVPPITSQPIQFPRNEDVTLRLTVKSAGGPLIDLTGYTITWTARRNSRDGGFLLRRTGVLVPIEGRGRVNIGITAANTKFLAAARYVYDVWAVKTSSQKQIIPVSQWVLLPGMIGPS